MSHLETRPTQQSSSSSTGARGRGSLTHSRIKHTRKREREYQGAGRYPGKLTPDGDQPEQTDEAEAAELEARYVSRTLGTNADRYEEPEPEIGLDGMNSIESHIVNMIRFNSADRTTNPRT